MSWPSWAFAASPPARLLASVAYGSMLRAARELLELGTTGYVRSGLSPDERAAAFGRPAP